MIAAAVVRALGSLRRRPGPTVAAAVGVFLAAVLAGTAVTAGYALATGFDRAQEAAGTADVIARFDTVQRADAEARLSALANVRSLSFRIVERPVDISARGGGERRRGTAEVNGLERGHERDGLAIVAGRALSGAPREAVIERGLADAWGLGPGDSLRVEGWRGRIVGVAVEPDNVAFPLAARPRVYLRAQDVRRDVIGTGGEPVNAAYLVVHDRRRLPETLVQARAASYGTTGLTFTTREGVRALVDQAGGLVGGLLVGFAAVALLATAAMLAAAGHARVTRDLPTIGALRAIGWTPGGLALSYGLEASAVALPASLAGVVTGAVLVRGQTVDLLHDLNELPPAAVVGAPHAAVVLGIAALAALAAAAPAYAAARRPVVDTLRGARIAAPRGPGSSGRPLLLGARLALARPGRLVVAALAVAAATATILLLLALARFLIEAQREPSAIGERYSLLVGGPDALARVLATPDVDAAVERLEVRGVDSFDLGNPVTLVAFGKGRGDVFAGRPLLDGRRAQAADEVEVGRGLADSLGLAPGGRLVAQLEGGGEVRLRVVGVVQELAADGRVGYTSLGALRSAAPGGDVRIATRPSAGLSVEELTARLESRGLFVEANAGLAPAGAPFVDTIVALLRVVAVVTGLVCGAIVLLSLVVLARERAETLAILRACGARPSQVVSSLIGAALVLLGVAVPLGYALQRAVYGPTVSRVVERYGVLSLQPSPREVAAVAAGALVLAVLAAALTGSRLARAPVVDALQAE